MKQINNFIFEKFKIDKNVRDASHDDSLFKVIQYENNGDKGGYSTFPTDNLIDYKYGFVAYNKDGEFIVLEVFNDFEEYAETPGWDEKDIKVLSRLGIGQSTYVQSGDLCIRLW